MDTSRATDAAVAAASRLAAASGASVLEHGGNAVDAAITTAAVMAVTSPHMCGLGGDLFALVLVPGQAPAALNASGRAGSGADPASLRAEGFAAMPFEHDVRSVTVPGFVDGLVALHERFGTCALADLLAPARRLAENGFPVSPTLAAASLRLAPEFRARMFGAPDALREGAPLTLPGVARALRDVAADGREGFYEGAVGAELLSIGAGLFAADDLRTPHADWVQPLPLAVFGRTLWTIPPNSQGYLTLASAWIAESAGVPEDPADEAWAFTLVEASRQAAFDRVGVLHERADGPALVSPDRLGPRAEAIAGRAGRGLTDVYGDGGTTYLCAVDSGRTGVSLIISNASGFGSQVVLPGYGISLQNRGIGFSLTPGHPAEYGPGRRPPHTLSPLAVTSSGGALDSVLGTMGGDAQPQILLQLLARTFLAGEDPGAAVAAPRWVLSRDPSSGFNLWDSPHDPIVRLEHGAPRAWLRGLARRGYRVAESPPGDHAFGHAQMIRVAAGDSLRGAADPRPSDGAFVAAGLANRS